jgi:hypothetical protein
MLLLLLAASVGTMPLAHAQAGSELRAGDVVARGPYDVARDHVDHGHPHQLTAPCVDCEEQSRLENEASQSSPAELASGAAVAAAIRRYPSVLACPCAALRAPEGVAHLMPHEFSLPPPG